MNESGKRDKYEKWTTVAAFIFFAASIIFHINLLGRVDDQRIRGMYYDAMNTPFPPPRQDFNALYTQANNLVSGKSIYTPLEELIERKQPQEGKINNEHVKSKVKLPPFRYLPIAALVGWPFTFLPFHYAYDAWILFHEILMLFALYILYKSARELRLALILGGMLLFFAPYYLEVYQGQFSWPQGFLMLLVLYHIDVGDEKWAMWAFVASILWKLNTILWVIPLAFARYWRWFAFLLGAVIVGSVPYFIIHPGDIKAFLLINIRPDLTHSYHFGNSGLRMLIDVILQRLEFVSGGNVPDGIVKYFSPLVALIIFGLTFWVSWRRRDDLIGCLLIFGTLYFLIYIDVWVHHWMMILPVVIWEYKRTRSPFVFIIWLILALPTRFDWISDFNELKPYFPHPEQAPNFGAALLYFSQKSLPALALWIWQFKKLMYPNNQVPIYEVREK
jgi:hypothetical protein